jgi:hypothetical protein
MFVLLLMPESANRKLKAEQIPLKCNSFLSLLHIMLQQWPKMYRKIPKILPQIVEILKRY